MELTVTNRSRAYPEGDGEGWKEIRKYSVLRVQRLSRGIRKREQEVLVLFTDAEAEKEIILDSSMVEHTAVNRGVVGSSPTRGVLLYAGHGVSSSRSGSMVKRLRHRPFTAVTRVRFPLESSKYTQLITNQLREELADVAQLAEQLICNQQVIGSSPIIGFKTSRVLDL